MKIWISHTYLDKVFVDQLSSYLQEEGHQIISLDHSMTAGEYLLDRITQSISEADALLLIISKNYSKSSWINTEVGLIIATTSTNQEKIFIPILIDKDLKLPSYLSNYYYVDYTNEKSFADNTLQVIKALNQRSIKGQNPQVSKSIYEALKQQEKLLKIEKENYSISRNKKKSFKIFSLLTVISTLLSSIIVILYFIKSDNAVDGFFSIDKFNVTSFVIGVISSIISIIVFTKLKKRN